MHLTMLALGSTGDVLPYLALGKGLKDAGYQVRFASFQIFQQRAVELGLDFHLIPGDPRFLVAQGGTNIFSMARSFGSLTKEYTKALSATSLLETDMIINQLPGGMFGRDLAEKADIPMVLAAVIPLVPTGQFPMLGFPAFPVPGFNKLTYSLAEIAAWSLFGAGINRWREEELGLPRLSRVDYFSHDWLVLNGFSSKVVHRPPEWDQRVQITGYWFPEDPSWKPPLSLEEFLARGKAPIFIGFGSNPIKDPAQITETILLAIKRSGQRAVLHSGWAGLGSINLPEDIYLLDYAPYDWLFPKMAMVIHHGGSGTTGFGLRAGVPSCAVPVGFDQKFWGERIADLGAGPEPVVLAKLTTERLCHMIQQGIGNEHFRHQAQKIGRELRQEEGIARAVRTISGKLSEPE
ncbi:MAG: glycosyltransferase [Anaerolineales bacterium]